MSTNMSGLSFGGFPHNLDGPAEQPAVLVGLSASWKSLKAQGKGCLTLPMASWGRSSVAGHGSSSCLHQAEVVLRNALFCHGLGNCL